MVDRSSPKAFYIYVRSCPRRSLDPSKLYTYFIKNNLISARNADEADLIVIYTCGGFNDTEEESLLTISRSLRTNAQVIITGCLPKINPTRLEVFKKARIITVENLWELDNLINAKIPFRNIPPASVVLGVHEFIHSGALIRLERNFDLSSDFAKLTVNALKNKIIKKPKISELGQKYYKLEISRGCLGSCSYCAIKKAMESFHSIPEEQIINSFRIGLSEGYRDFAIIGGDIGCYGFDLKTNLPTLLKKILNVDGDYKLLLVDLNPRWLRVYYSDLKEVLMKNSINIAGLIIPIQSGSDRVLELMKRGYRAKEVKEYVQDMQRSAGIPIETHIMVGFPGETSDDFQDSIRLIQEISFDCVHIFKYEDRPGTASSELPGKLSKACIKKRARILTKASKTYTVRYGIDGLRL